MLNRTRADGRARSGPRRATSVPEHAIDGVAARTAGVSQDVETDGGSEARPDDEGCPVRSCDLYEAGRLGDLEARLMTRFSPPLRPEQVQRCLVETVVRFDEARVRAYLPVLIERAATDQLHTEVRHLPAAAIKQVDDTVGLTTGRTLTATWWHGVFQPREDRRVHPSRGEGGDTSSGGVGPQWPVVAARSVSQRMGTNGPGDEALVAAR